MADKWDSIEGNSIHGMNFNLSGKGNKKMLYGKRTTGFNIRSSGPINFEALNKSKYADVMSVERRDIFKKLFNNSRQDAYGKLDALIADWKSVTGDNDPFSGLTDAYATPIFDTPLLEDHYLDDGIDANVISKLTGAARLIALAKLKGEKRVVISVGIGGFDTHARQYEKHSPNYRGISIGLDRFTRAIEHLGLSNNVTTFSLSEFGRCTVANGDGTDHGWGSSFFVLGGSVKAGNYGTFPDLTPGGVDDSSNKGRLIPTTSVTQYYATILKWFGADEGTLDEVLPELRDFDIRDLGFMKTEV